MKIGRDAVKWMRKKAKQGARSYPAGTLAFYGPDASRASKLVASIMPGPEQEPAMMRKWFDETHDIRGDAGVLAEAAEFLREQGRIAWPCRTGSSAARMKKGSIILWASRAPNAPIGPTATAGREKSSTEANRLRFSFATGKL